MKPRQTNSSPLNKPIVYSAIIHAMIFVTLFAFPGMYIPFMEKPMRIDVQWVELPKGTGEDLDFGVKNAEGLPKSTIEEQKKEFQPEEAPKQTSIKPEMTALPAQPPEEKAAPKAKPEPRPQIDTSRMKLADKGAKPAKPTPGADRKIKNALAMIDKDLTGRQVVPESGQVESTGKGYKYGTGDKPAYVSRSDPEFLRYAAMVKSKVKRGWIPPAMEKKTNAQIIVMINMDGDVTTTRWAKMSGNQSFDSSVKRAVTNASPFPRPPDRIVWEAINEGFTVDFVSN